MAWTVASIFGNELNNIVMAFGLAWRIAYNGEAISRSRHVYH